MGFGSDDFDQDYIVKTTDFVVNEGWDIEEPTQNNNVSSFENSNSEKNENFFYSKIGFEVGKFFEGERKIYQRK